VVRCVLGGGIRLGVVGVVVAEECLRAEQRRKRLGSRGCACVRDRACSHANVLETLLTAQTGLVLQTATYRKDIRERSTQADTKTSKPGNGVLNTEQGGVSYKPTEAAACAKAEPAHRQRLLKRMRFYFPVFALETKVLSKRTP